MLQEVVEEVKEEQPVFVLPAEPFFHFSFFFSSQAVLTREERVATRKHLASFTEPIKVDSHQKKNDFAN